MTHERFGFWGVVFSAVVVMAAVPLVGAATLNVDANAADPVCDDEFGEPYCTIQAAIDDALDGDTILVAPGVYVENLDIDRGLNLWSTGGAEVTSIVGDSDATPVVLITSAGVTIGAVGQGFTIVQESTMHPGNHSGDSAVKVEGDAVGAGTVVVQENVLVGNDTDEGVLINPPIAGGRLVIQNNTFRISESDGATYGFKDVMHFHYMDFGGEIGDAAANTAVLDLLGNTATDFDRSAIYFHDDVYLSDVNIADSTFNGGSADYGVYFYDDIRGLSVVNISDTSFDDVGSGVYIDDDIASQSIVNLLRVDVSGFTGEGVYVGGDVEELSELTIDWSTFSGDGASDGIYLSSGLEEGSLFSFTNSEVSGFGGYGIYTDDVEDGSTVLITDSTIEGDEADYGIYSDLDDGASVVIHHNTIGGISEYGVYASDTEDNSSTVITENTIELVDDGSDSYGVYMEYGPNYGSTGEIRNNTITGFNYAGVYAYEVYYGSTLAIEGNQLTAHEDGADYGIYQDDVYDGSTMTIINNTVVGFDEYGLYLDDHYDGSTVTIQGNTFTSHPDGNSEDGIYLYSIYYGSAVTIADNVITGFENAGLYVSDDVYEDGTLIVANNTFTADAGDGAYYGVYMDEVYYGAWTVFTNNTFTGLGTCGGASDSGCGYGFYNYEWYEGAHLIMSDNSFVANSGGIEYGFYTEYGWEYGSTGTITGSSFDGFSYAGFYNGYYIEDGSTLTMHDNAFAAHEDGADYGMYLGDGLDDGSIADIQNNIFDGFTYAGFYNDDCVDAGSQLHIIGNTFTAHSDGADYGIYQDDTIEYSPLTRINDNVITGFTDTGVYIDYVSNGTEFSFEGNELTAHPDGASYGFYNSSGFEDGVLVTLSKNNISGVGFSGGDSGDGYGFYLYDCWYGCEMELCGNTIAAGPNEGYTGIYLDYPPGGGSVMTICDNVIDDYLEESIYFGGGSYDGGFLEINGNDLSDASHGIYFDGALEEGLISLIVDNSIDGFDSDGIYFGSDIWGNVLLIAENRLTGTGSEGNGNAGIRLSNSVNSGTAVDITGNCIQNVPVGVFIDTVEDTASVVVNFNNFVNTQTGVEAGEGVDEDHAIDATNNFWGSADAPGTGGSAGVIGEVIFSPSLTGSVDTDSDGVENCTDMCPGTVGVSVDSSGCEFQAPPPPGGGGDVPGDDGEEEEEEPDEPAPDIFGSGTTDEDGNFEMTIVDENGQVVAEIEISGSDDSAIVAFSVTEGDDGLSSPPGPGGGTYQGFAGDLALGRTLTVESSAADGSFTAVLSITFTAEELGELDPNEVEMHRLDTSVDPPVWTPLGNNVGESPVTDVVGDCGFFFNLDGSVTFWCVRDTLSIFAVGARQDAEIPADEEQLEDVEEDVEPADTPVGDETDGVEADDGTEGPVDEPPTPDRGDDVGEPSAEQTTPTDAPACGAGAAPCGAMGMISLWAMMVGLAQLKIGRAVMCRSGRRSARK